MHILIVNNTVIPARDYGGTERVIWWLGKELVRLGHKVTYLTAPGSSCPFAEVLTYDPRRPFNQLIPATVDILHLHCRVNETPKKPYLMTHHGNSYPEKTFDINTVFVSRNHAQRNGAEAFVYNGLDVEEYGLVDFLRHRKYLLFLAYAKRPDKNLADCLRIARRTKNILAVIGGKPKWYNWRPWAEYKGFLAGDDKHQVLQESQALLFPVRWHEPFGLAVIEAMYFGCPVIGTPYGSLPELVRQDVGFLSNRRSKMIEAVRSLGQFDPRRCNRYVCENFTSHQMTQNYLRLYEKVLNKKPLNPRPPVNGGNFSPQQLLPVLD